LGRRSCSINRIPYGGRNKAERSSGSWAWSRGPCRLIPGHSSIPRCFTSHVHLAVRGEFYADCKACARAFRGVNNVVVPSDHPKILLENSKKQSILQPFSLLGIAQASVNLPTHSSTSVHLALRTLGMNTKVIDYHRALSDADAMAEVMKDIMGGARSHGTRRFGSESRSVGILLVDE
jgi:hypothetical protein